MPRTRAHLPQTLDAVAVLGAQIAAARRRRRMPARELAERAGITEVTLRKVERGDPSVAIGTVFDAVGVVGVELFGADPSQLPSIVRRTRDQLALLPARVRSTRPLDNDF